MPFFIRLKKDICLRKGYLEFMREPLQQQFGREMVLPAFVNNGYDELITHC